MMNRLCITCQVPDVHGCCYLGLIWSAIRDIYRPSCVQISWKVKIRLFRAQIQQIYRMFTFQVIFFWLEVKMISKWHIAPFTRIPVCGERWRVNCSDLGLSKGLPTPAYCGFHPVNHWWCNSTEILKVSCLFTVSHMRGNNSLSVLF